MAEHHTRSVVSTAGLRASDWSHLCRISALMLSREGTWRTVSPPFQLMEVEATLKDSVPVCTCILITDYL